MPRPPHHSLFHHRDDDDDDDDDAAADDDDNNNLIGAVFSINKHTYCLSEELFITESDFAQVSSVPYFEPTLFSAVILAHLNSEWMITSTEVVLEKLSCLCPWSRELLQKVIVT